MKNTITYILLFSFLAINLFAQNSSSRQIFPTVELSSDGCSFGEISQDSVVVSRTFTMTNTGKTNLVIVEVFPPCPCVSLDYSTKPIKPGASTTLKVSYDITGQSYGAFHKTIIIALNTQNKRQDFFVEGIILSPAATDGLM